MAGYLAALAVTVLLLFRPVSPRVAPVLAPVGAPRPEIASPDLAPDLGSLLLEVLAGGPQAVRALGKSPEARWGKWALRNGLPAFPSPVAPRDASSGEEVLAEGFYLLSGMRWADPLSWLRLSLPALPASPPPPLAVLPPGEVPSGPGKAVLPEEMRGKILVGLYCTHARESYLPALAEARDPEEAHTTDPSRNMLRVAEELARALSQEHGMGVVLSRNVHDREGKLGAYLRSYQTATLLLKNYPQVRFLFDVHRDSARREATVTRVGSREAARIMIVLGSQRQVGSGWAENKALADRVAAVLEERYPGLLRRILVADARYNQHLSRGALLFEIGGVDNTLEEALLSARLLADVLSVVIVERVSASGR